MEYNSRLTEQEKEIFDKMKDEGLEYSHTDISVDMEQESDSGVYKATKSHYFVNEYDEISAIYSFEINIGE